MNGQTNETANYFVSLLSEQLTVEGYVMCALCALACGAVFALVLAFFTNGKKYSFSFLSTVVLLPLIVQTVIMLVNGHVGTGIAVAGAFSLVRFRSIPGSAKDIAIIFLAMALGLATGTGYVGVGIALTAIGSLIFIILWLFGKKADVDYRQLRITIPENLDYEGAFDDLFEKYTRSCTLSSVKTTNMGSLFKLKYKLKFKDGVSHKEFVDELRERNGNLEISISILKDEEQL